MKRLICTIIVFSCCAQISYAQLAAGCDKFLGNIHSSSQMTNYTEYWNQVTPENAGKWDSVEHTRDVMTWSSLDAAYNFAKNNDFPFRLHVLVWGNQQPAWIESLPPDEQLEEIEEWFIAVADRYPDLDYVEVVNEPLHDPPNQPGSGGGNYIDALGGSGDTGWDWVLNAFRMAQEYFPTAKLMINEYSVENTSNDARRYVNIIRLLQAEDLIDAIGIQGHAFSTRVSAATLNSNLNIIAATGLPIQITEFDIDGPTDETQLQDYQRIFPAFWEHPAVMGITFWGWRRGCWRTAQGAYLVQSNGDERPALAWLREYLTEQLVSVKKNVEEPNEYAIIKNYPNPFNPQTTIEYTVEKPSHVSLEIYDITGKKIKTLVSEVQIAAIYKTVWDATDDSGDNMPSGVYLCRLKMSQGFENVVRTNRMILLK